MPTVTLPDGSTRSYDAPVTPAQVAADIGPGLAKVAMLALVDGDEWDIGRVIETDAALSLVREKLQHNEPEQALLLLELFEGFDTEPELMALLMELRIKVLSQLRERATVTGNDYELYWLDSELEKAGSALP